MDHLIPCYNPLPVQFTKGEGVWLWDTDHKRYLDALSGIAVCGLGHAHPAITAAIQDQAAQLLHTSNVYQITHQIELAKVLTKRTHTQSAFFCNSGAEANETAIKLARAYGHAQDIQNPVIIAMDGAFHGRTLATLTATSSRKVQAGFEPLVRGFLRAPYNNIEAIQKLAETRTDISAILVEPIQGEGGIRLPDPGYLKQLKQLCDEHHWLLMLDEIQAGMGRTGLFLAQQHDNISADVITLAKALGNGVPIGACLVGPKAANVFKPGMHGSTFGGNPLACRVAHTVLEVMEQDKLIQNAKAMGNYLLTGLHQTLQDENSVKEIRGRGLMIGIELDKPCRPLMITALEHGLLFNVTQEKVIRLLPPLILQQNEADQIIEILSSIIKKHS